MRDLVRWPALDGFNLLAFRSYGIFVTVMKKVFLLVVAFSLPIVSHAATATDPRGLTRRIAPQLPPRTSPGTPGAPAVVPPSDPPIDPAKAEAAKAATDKKRLEFQTKKAEAGADYAQYDLGIRYLNGDGVEKNVDTGKKWLEKAAKNGHSGAKKKLQELKDEAK